MSGTTSTSAAPAGRFTVENGQIKDPAGNRFEARGIAVSASEMGAASEILANFPGLNFVRLSVYDYRSPEAYAAFIDTMTSHHVVVELEDHISSDGANQGGSRGSAFTGSQLTDEMNWYSSVASAYASNPYVWFGTDNEPPAAGLTAWQKQTYDTIRSTGNLNPVMVELPGGGWIGPQDARSYGLNPDVYAGMSNIIMDVHLYGWYSDYSTDQQVVDRLFSDLVRGAESVPSASGLVPVMVGEYGISTDGQKPDVNAAQVFKAAQGSSQTVGAVAFTWAGGGADSLSDGNGVLTPYGIQVAQWIASSAATSAQALHSTTSDTVSAAPAAISNPSLSFIDASSNPGNSTAEVAGQGITYLLPAAGLGVAYFNSDILAAGGGTLDLRAALAATDWDGSASTLPRYLTVGGASDASSIMVAATSGGIGTTIATIAGAPNLNLETLLLHSAT